MCCRRLLTVVIFRGIIYSEALYFSALIARIAGAGLPIARYSTPQLSHRRPGPSLLQAPAAAVPATDPKRQQRKHARQPTASLTDHRMEGASSTVRPPKLQPTSHTQHFCEQAPQLLCRRHSLGLKRLLLPPLLFVFVAPVLLSLSHVRFHTFVFASTHLSIPTISTTLKA